MKDLVLQELKNIVGENHVSDDPVDLLAFEKDDQFWLVPPRMPDFVVRPGSVEEIQAIMRLANRYKIPVIPLSAGINRKGLCIPSEGGIILDLRRMNRIIEINEEMMTAIIEPGVTYGQLVFEAAKKGLRPLTPAAPATVSVVANHLLRSKFMLGSKYGDSEPWVLGLEVVLPNGDVLRTGSWAFPNSPGPYCNKVCGPDLGKLFLGSPGNLGIVTKMCIALHPIPKIQRPEWVFFERWDGFIKAVSELMIEEIASRISGMWGPPLVWEEMWGLKVPEPGGLGLSILIEGNDEARVALYEKIRDRIIERAGGKYIEVTPERREGFLKNLAAQRKGVGEWRQGNMYGCSLYAPLKNAPRLFEVSYALAKKYGFEKRFHYVVSSVWPFRGQLMYQDPSFPWSSAEPGAVEKIRRLHKELMKALMDVGIYGWFRPFPGVVDVNMLGKYGELWRAIKQLLDPNNILNPGKPPMPTSADFFIP